VAVWNKCVLFAVLMFAGGVLSDEVYTLSKRAQNAWKSEQYETALKLHQQAFQIDSTDPTVRTNLAGSLYKNQKFAEAAALADSLRAQASPLVSKNANIIAGNALFQSAMQSAKQQNIAQAKQSLTKARDHFINALKIDYADSTAKHNLELTQLLLDQLNQQNQDQQQQDQQQQDQQQQDQQQQDQQQQDQQQQDQQQQDQQQQDQQQQDQQQQDQQQQSEPVPDPEVEKQQMQRQQALRLLEQYADDDQELHKPKIIPTQPKNPQQKDW